MDFLMRALVRFLPFWIVRTRYIGAGNAFVAAINRLYTGPCPEFEAVFKRWEWWEREIMRRRYRPVSLDGFIAFTVPGQTTLFIEQLAPGEVAQSYALAYRERYFKGGSTALL